MVASYLIMILLNLSNLPNVVSITYLTDPKRSALRLLGIMGMRPLTKHVDLQVWLS